MQMTGEQPIAAPRRKVWEALNDPAVLAQCIPGCQSLEADGDNRFAVAAEVKIGPIGARFRGSVQLSDLDAPNGYTITGSGSGGIAGNAKGGAKVRLTDDGAGGTVVAYAVDAEVGGRMAQLGGPIIDATARQLAGRFFAKFGDVVTGGGSGAGAAEGIAPAASGAATMLPVSAPVAAAPASRAPLWGWVAALLAAILTGFVLGQIGAPGGVVALVLALLVLTAAAAFEAGRRGAGR